MQRLADFNVSSIDKALGTVVDKGRSPRTVNVYRRCCHSLAEWAVKNELLDRNPVALIERRNEAADTRKVRRSLTADEDGVLFLATGLQLGPLSIHAVCSKISWSRHVTLSE